MRELLTKPVRLGTFLEVGEVLDLHRRSPLLRYSHHRQSLEQLRDRAKISSRTHEVL